MLFCKKKKQFDVEEHDEIFFVSFFVLLSAFDTVVDSVYDHVHFTIVKQ